jgi:hypothetical protein
MSEKSLGHHSGRNSQESVERRMTSYALAAATAGVSLLALAPPATGEVVVTKTNLIVGFGGNTPVSIDLNHDGINDFQFQWNIAGYDHSFYGMLAISPLTGGKAMGGNRGPMGPYASALVRGANIGPSAHFSSSAAQGQLIIERSTGFVSASSQYSDFGQWGKVGNNRYLGVKFLIKGQTHYGWVRLSVNNALRNTATITALAYETVANKKIAAGITTVSAETQAKATSLEKGSPSLGMLAMGADGWAMWRRD